MIKAKDIKIAVLLTTVYVIGYLTAHYTYTCPVQEIKESKCEYERKACRQTLEMYYYDKYNKNYTSTGATAVAYCGKNILLIDIENREYWEALESFNHEWQHCKWKDHYNQSKRYNT